MSIPIIGIAANQLIHATDTFNGNYVTYTPQGFVDGVQQAGGLPLLLPINDPNLVEDYVKQIDKLLLAGGQDVSPALYNEEPHPKLGETNLTRDAFEAALIKEAIKQNKPVFAVCRGMQLLNVVLGGTLYQDLSMYEDWEVKHNQVPTQPWFATHSIEIEEPSLLGSFLGSKHQVNSYHHQAVKDLAPSLKAIAWSKDGIIEAVESQEANTRLLGVQWHPELTHKADPKEQQLFDYFVNQL